MRNSLGYGFLIAVICLAGCSLFNNLPEADLEKKMDEAIAWANAEKLTVSVAYPQEWGSSPQNGTGRCFDDIRTNEIPRKDYSFTVEFTPMPGYGFEEWLAFPSGIYTGLDKTATAAQVRGEAFDSDEVTIEPVQSAAGAQTAKVTIHITGEDVTLVPWCGNRPRLSQQTNPPLNPILTPFPFDQQVTIWFTMEVKTSTLSLAETIATDETIRISAINLVDGPNGQRGQPFTGDLATYFHLQFPGDNDFVDHVTLAPIAESAGNLAWLNISVTVGPGIENKAGIPMTQAETISYQTNADMVQKAYRAEGIEACQTEDGDFFSNTGTGMAWNNPEIDRRFNESEKETVYLKFSVPPLVGAPAVPDWIRITERYANDLRGVIMGGETGYAYYYTGTPDVGTDGGKFTITHSLQTTYPGIIQLLVQPGNGATSAPEFYLSSAEALAEGQYVTIVLDTVPPDLTDLRASLSQPSSTEPGTGNFIYGEDVPVTLTLAGLSNIADNGAEGGLSTAQAWSLPWTMDAKEDLWWSVQIGRDGQANLISSGWRKVYDAGDWNNTWTQASLSALTPETAYPVLVKFKDKKGNESAEWKETGFEVKYTTAEVNSVSNLKAVCNEDGDLITVSWDEPDKYAYPEIVIRTYRASPSGDIFESETRHDFGKIHADSYLLSVSQITTNKVREGDAVSGVYGYEISVIAHNIAGNTVTGPIWVYNIPDMDANADNIIRITEDSGQFIVNSEQLGSNIVLTRDLTLTSHIPITTFSGNFYGNGHTVTINGFDAAAPADNRGLFGVVNGALIRDLSVEYSSDASGGGNVGGFAGQANGATVILNSIVRGSGGVLSATGNTSYLGGIVGQMQSSATIRNCRAALTVSGFGRSYVGGVAGAIGTGGHNEEGERWKLMDGVTVCADITGSGQYVGGVLGSSDSTGLLYDITVTGGIIRLALPSMMAYGSYYGGIAGYITNTSLIDCVWQGTLDLTDNEDTSPYVGGIVGYYMSLALTGDLASQETTRPQPEISSASSSGIIQYWGKSKPSYQQQVGGVIGSISGQYDYLDKCPKVRNCLFNGELDIEGGGTGSMMVGGLLAIPGGNAYRYCGPDIKYCQVSSRRFIVSYYGSFSLFVGGFAACSFGSTDFSDCYSEGVIEVPNAPNTAIVILSGFLGQANSGNGTAGVTGLTRCSSVINLVSTSPKPQYLGGLTGHIAGSTVTIANCFVSGSITATGASNSLIYAGGLMGDLITATTIRNSYAKVDIIVDNSSSGMVCAGGLAGSNSNGTIDRSFSAGTVYAASSSGIVYSGGICGRGTTVSNCAVLGAKVAATGSVTPYLGRITGDTATAATANNYAGNWMLTGAAAYDLYVSGAPAAGGSLGNKDGKDAGPGAFRTLNQWETLLRFNQIGSYDEDEGEPWDFSSLTAKGYPTLVGVGGQ